MVGIPFEAVDDLHFRAIDEITTPFLVVDERAVIRIVNKACELLLWYHRSEMLGNHVNMLVPDAMQEKHLELTKGYVTDPKIVMYQRQMGAADSLIQIKRKDGELINVEVDIGPFSTTEGLFIVATIRVKK